MLLSRVADGLYWIGRYVERAEHTVRLVDVRLDLALDRGTDGDGWRFERLFTALSLKPAAVSMPASVVETLVFDAAHPASVVSCLTAARENARQVREEISSEMWEQLNALFLRLREARSEGAASARPHYVSRLVIDGAHLFEGVTDATMGHGEGWQYVQLGRFIERAGATATLIDLHVNRQPPMPSAHIEWIGLLRSCAALEAYCRCYTADLRPDRIMEFLLLNPEFPRSVRFAASRIEAALRTIRIMSGRSAGARAERLAGRLHASLDYGQVDEILEEDPHAFLGAVGRLCGQIHASTYQSYITYPIESALPA